MEGETEEEVEEEADEEADEGEVEVKKKKTENGEGRHGSPVYPAKEQQALSKKESSSSKKTRLM